MKNKAAAALAKKRWKGYTKEQRKKEMEKVWKSKKVFKNKDN